MIAHRDISPLSEAEYTDEDWKRLTDEEYDSLEESPTGVKLNLCRLIAYKSKHGTLHCIRRKGHIGPCVTYRIGGLHVSHE